MIDYSSMKQNMIEGQLLPGRITETSIINAFKELPREYFLPDHLKPFAYSDKHISLENNRFLMAPLSIALMIQATKITTDEIILVIGSWTGYESSIISKLSSTVIALDSNKELKKIAEKNIRAMNINNIVLVNGKHNLGYKKYAPYDLIFISGSVNNIKSSLFDQLGENGRLIACKPHNQVILNGKVIIYTKTSGVISKQYLFDLALPKMEGFENVENNNFVL